jgi:hypothetical protein
MLAPDRFFYRLPEFCNRFKPARFGECIVSRDCSRSFNRLRGDHKLGGFAGKLLLHVMLREGDLQCPGFAGDNADELILKSRNERIRADKHNGVVAGSAFERLSVDRARK